MSARAIVQHMETHNPHLVERIATALHVEQYYYNNQEQIDEMAKRFGYGVATGAGAALSKAVFEEALTILRRRRR